MSETPARQEANRIARKGTKRPESGSWPVASEKATHKAAKKMALEKVKSKGHKHGEREATAKRIGYYPHGHKNYGDVYEA